MNSERSLIAATAFLVVGVSLIIGYCHGTIGFSAAYPVTGASLNIVIDTKGLPAMAGFGATIVGLLLLIVALVQAIVGQVHWPGEKAKAPARAS